MQTYVVLYYSPRLYSETSPPTIGPLTFKCEADDVEHAREQVIDAESDADIVWVEQTDDVGMAHNNYWEN